MLLVICEWAARAESPGFEKVDIMDFQVVILAGCEYAGLHPLTPDIPKMLLPIGNKPLLACVLDMLEGLVERFHGPVLIVTPPSPPVPYKPT